MSYMRIERSADAAAHSLLSELRETEVIGSVKPFIAASSRSCSTSLGFLDFLGSAAAAFGFGGAGAGADAHTGSAQLLLRLQVSHAHERFAAAHASVRWVVRGVASAPARVACNATADPGSAVGAVALAPRWTHAPGTHELHVSVAGGSSSPSCSVYFN